LVDRGSYQIEWKDSHNIDEKPTSQVACRYYFTIGNFVLFVCRRQRGEKYHDDIDHEDKVKRDICDAPSLRLGVEGDVQRCYCANKHQQCGDGYVPEQSGLVVLVD